jgi:hypothetical protein
MRDAHCGMALERGDELTLQAWDQAWQQARHLETMRSQYLGFFFTAVLGVTALAGPRLADDSLRSAGDLLTVAALTVALELLTGFLYISVIRVNKVLGHYTTRIELISSWMGDNGAVLDLASFVRESPPARRWAGTSGSAQVVLRSSLLGLPFLSAAIVLRTISLSDSAVVIGCCALGLALSCVVVAAVRVGLTGPQEK